MPGKTHLGKLLLCAAAGLVISGPAAAAAKVTVQESQEYGPYLADAEGRALYMFTTDTQGQGQAEAKSSCHDACADAWPPLSAEEGDPQAGERAQGDLLDTMQREDGSTQVTYNGWPLYYFVKDTGPGETQGQDVHGFGGEWYLLTPQGEEVAEK